MFVGERRLVPLLFFAAIVLATVMSTSSAMAQMQSGYKDTPLACGEFESFVPTRCSADGTLQNTGTLDAEGRPTTAPVFAAETVFAAAAPIGAAAEPLWEYATGSLEGALVMTGTTVDRVSPGTSTGRQDASQNASGVGSCELFRPETLVYYRRERDHYGYYANAAVRCENGNENSVQIRLFRSRDGAMVAESGCFEPARRGPSECVGQTSHEGYARRTAHYASAVINIQARAGYRWGDGPGPDGWSCSGQRTQNLRCVAVSSPES